jgi:hypothetical protein
MAQRESETYDANGRRVTKTVGPDTEALKDLESASDRARLQSTKGRGLGIREQDTTGMPKMMEGETPAEFGERMRKYREEKRAGQKKVLAPAAQ